MAKQLYSVKIENINESVKEPSLYAAFKKKGFVSIHSVVIGKNKTHAYVNLLSAKDASQAVQKLHETYINGNKIRVSLAPRKNFEKVTDCKYGDLCSKNKECPYRHNVEGSEICSDWQYKPGRCSKVKCPKRHPSKIEEEEEAKDATPPSTPKEEKVESSGQSEIFQSLEKNCECPICLERMCDPRTLTCHHSFCKECLDETVQVDDYGMASIKCPSCRENTYLESTVSKLKCDLHLKSNIDLLMTTQPKSIDTPKCSDKSCESGVPDRACTDCSQLICSKSCLIKHYQVGKCECKHLVEIRFSVRDGNIAPYCQQHETFAKYYCTNADCLQYNCVFCKHHLTHSNKSLSSLGKKFDEVFEKWKTDAIELQTNNQSTKDKIQSAMDEKIPIVRKHINDFKYEMMTKTWLALNQVEDELCKELESSCRSYKKEANQSVQSAKKLIRDIDKLSQSTPFSKIMNSQKLQKLHTEVDDKCKKERDFEVDFQPNQYALDDNLFDFIDSQIGMVKISMNKDSDVTEVKPLSSSIKNSEQLERLESSNTDYKDYFHQNIIPQFLQQQSVKGGKKNVENKTKEKAKKNKKKEPPPQEINPTIEPLIQLGDLTAKEKKKKKKKNKKKAASDSQEPAIGQLIDLEGTCEDEIFSDSVSILSGATSMSNDDYEDTEQSHQISISSDSESEPSDDDDDGAKSDGGGRRRRPRQRSRRGGSDIHRGRGSERGRGGQNRGRGGQNRGRGASDGPRRGGGGPARGGQHRGRGNDRGRGANQHLGRGGLIRHQQLSSAASMPSLNYAELSEYFEQQRQWQGGFGGPFFG
ncbi:uncharacterized protein [Clytia hemisphaerica]|uniref:Uncharacterized protein n=1 Tax=Clytia hemisphaerica TaxID=252671 RepID=A0A7M5X5J2_9CNID